MRTKLNRKGVAGYAPTVAAALVLAITLILNACDNGGSNSGSCSSFAPDCGSGGSCDINDYRTVKIGDQIWMAENLNCNVNGSKCYGNLESNCNIYGRLYNWATANIVCPSGWHLPTKAEYETLDNAVGGSSTAGTKLKAKSGWNSGGNGTDDYGFSALPGGCGNSDGYFDYVGYSGGWWSASEIGHSSITTTQIYTHVSTAKQKEILAAKHPRNKIVI
jgi:uncharacterized protein (TIGR02145 family)